MVRDLATLELAVNASECPDDVVLDEFVRGHLDAATTRSVDEHMDRCESCSELVGLLARSQRAPIPDSATLEPGAEVGPYVLRSLLGEGASGLVYLAWDPRLEREVALKILRPERARDPIQRERVRREATALARLAHENIVTVFDVGEARGGLFVAMEVVRGPTLRAWLDAGARPASEALAVVVAAGRGLAAAHARGVLHRDVKPENIVIGEDRVRLADFGLASPTLPSSDAEGGELSPSLTQSGVLLGTPLYMAPETLDGAAATERSDLFSLGVVAYEALVGERPFVASSIAELRASIARGPTAKRTNVDRALLRVVLRALAPKPDERPASVAAWIAELERAPRRSTPVASFAALAFAATLAVSFGVGLRSARSSSPTAALCQSAPSPFDAASQRAIERVFSQREPRSGPTLARELCAALARWAQRWESASSAACAGPSSNLATAAPSPELREARRRCLDAARGDFLAVVSSLEGADRTAILASGTIAFELPSIERCADTRALLSTEARPADAASAREITRAESLIRQSISSMTNGHYREATERAAQAELAASASRWAPVRSRAARTRARALRLLGEHTEAIRSARRAALLAEGARDDDGAARSWLELVASEGARGAWEQTLAAIDQAAASVRRTADPSLESSVALLEGLAQSNMGRLERASTALDRALALRAQHGGDRSPVLSAQANIARERGELDRALALHREAMQLDRARTGADHPDQARHLHNIAGVLRRLDRRDEAREHYRRALDLEERWLGPRAIERGLELNSLGLLALDERSFDEAERLLVEAESILGDTIDRPLATLNRALVALGRGQPGSAEAHARDALARDVRFYGPTHVRVARARKVLGLALLAAGSLREARVELESSSSIVASRTDLDAATIRVECVRALAELSAREASARRAPRVRSLRDASSARPATVATSTETAATVTTATTTAATTGPTGSSASTTATTPRVQPSTRDGFVPAASGSGSYGAAQRWTP